MGYFVGIIVLALFAILQNSLIPELLAVIQTSVAPGFEQLHGQPELVMLAVLAWAWHTSDAEAIFWAFAGGIMQDILNPIIPTGLSTITFVTAIMVLKTIGQNFYQFSIFALIALVSVATLMHHILVYLWLGFFQAYPINLVDYFRDFTIPTMGFNLLTILPLYWFLRRIQNRIPRQQVGWETASS